MIENITFENFTASEKLINRELSWLRFNIRVMEESNNKNYPLLERLRFLSISGSNLDEFYMVRVAGLRGLMISGTNVVSNEGLSPKEQIEQINKVAGKLIAEQQVVWAHLVKELKKSQLNLLNTTDILPNEK